MKKVRRKECGESRSEVCSPAAEINNLDLDLASMVLLPCKLMMSRHIASFCWERSALNTFYSILCP